MNFKPLLETIWRDRNRAAVAKALDRLQLPNPDSDEYICIRKGTLIGLPFYGAVIRLERQDKTTEPPILFIKIFCK